jgi:hypothetical protein
MKTIYFNVSLTVEGAPGTHEGPGSVEEALSSKGGKTREGQTVPIKSYNPRHTVRSRVS